MFSLQIKMDIKVNLEILESNDGNLKIDPIKFQKMVLLFNSIEQGWTVKKRAGSYVFTKSHGGIKEVFEENYLTQFMQSNFDVGKLLL